MFVSYCVDILLKAPTSVPGILSALRYQLNMRYIRSDVTAAFDNCLRAAAKAGVARRPYEPQVRLPCKAHMRVSLWTISCLRWEFLWHIICACESVNMRQEQNPRPHISSI